MTEPEKQVSEVPLETAPAARRRGGNILFLVILFSASSLTAGGAWWWIKSNRTEPNHHVTQWPQYRDEDYYRVDSGDHEAALAQMGELADALVEYRQGPLGGGVRWPVELAELWMAGNLDPDFDTTGVLSGEPIVYQPDIPTAHDPSRWVLCHDIEIGWRRAGQSGYTTRGPRKAAVILGDGTVKLLESDEMDQYGGLNMRADPTK